MSTFTVGSGEPWGQVLAAGATLRIIDLEGTQAVDVLFFNACNPIERYSAVETIRAQRNFYLSTGTVLLSDEGNALARIAKDTCGRHDTVGGACVAEGNASRFGPATKYMHNCRDNFLVGLSRFGLTKRDIVPNVNFFMNVPLGEAGQLQIADGISKPGDHVDLVMEMDTLVVISNCPQINNPCNGWNPTPIRLDWTEPGHLSSCSG